jgi:hypothetical protein
MRMPEPLQKRLHELRTLGRAMEAADLTYGAWFNPRMIVAKLVVIVLLPPLPGGRTRPSAEALDGAVCHGGGGGLDAGQRRGCGLW